MFPPARAAGSMIIRVQESVMPTQGGDAAPSRLRVRGLARAGLGPFSFALEPGACLAITGRSGSGKSLLLRMIADLDPHQGEAWLDGKPRAGMAAPAWRRQVVYCAAESGWWHRDVAAHFPAPPPLALAAGLGLPAAIFSQEMRLCSTGERQRLSLLRALALAPPVLLLDEPAGPLDPESTARLEALLRDRLRAGAAIILVTHDPRQAARMAGEHFIMADGRLSPA
jgi:ABC-type iron transport system FetAB ATPase subunit